MKKVLTILMFSLMLFGYSQEIEKRSTISSSDFFTENGRTKFKGKTFFYKNGNNEYVPVITSIFMSDAKFKEISIEKINEMILVSNNKIPFNLKNKSTYNPKEIRVDFVEKENHWTVSIDYTAQNNFGATKDSYSFVYFNNDGTFKNIVNF